jgi:prepilin-type N-terminal cleavage/methylation domain-containing protein
MKRSGAGDAGFTLIELIMAIVIMGIITVPLGNFVLSYFENYTQTESRLAGSHDIQIAAAYFSDDVANVGLRDATAPYALQPSVSTAPTGTYCGSGLGATLVLLKWDDWTVSSSGGNNTGTDNVHSVAYVAISGTLHRVYCASGTTMTANTTVVHNLVYPDAGNPTPVTCSSTCNAAPPTSINLRLGIKAPDDTSITYQTLSGQRRQS